MKAGVAAFALALLASALGAGAAPAAGPPKSPKLYEQEADCPYVKLDDPDGPMVNVPTFDQGTSDTCYAHTAATLMTTTLQNERPGPSGWAPTDSASPIDAAFLDLFKRGHKEPNASYITVKVKGKVLEDSGGQVCSAYDSIVGAGVCKNTKFRGTKFDVDWVGQVRMAIATMVRNHTANSWTSTEERSNLNYLHTLVQIQACLPDDQLEAAFKTLDDEVETILKEVKKSTVAKEIEFVHAVLDSICEPRVPVTDAPACRHYDYSKDGDKTSAAELYSGKRKKSEIDAAFAANRPIGVGYCGSLLDESTKNKKNPSVHGNYLSGNKDGTVSENYDCGGHWSVLAGQRWNGTKHRCEYLIRNSWGKDCDGYNGDWECIDHPGASPDSPAADQGDVWVGAHALMRNTDELATIVH